MKSMEYMHNAKREREREREREGREGGRGRGGGREKEERERGVQENNVNDIHIKTTLLHLHLPTVIFGLMYLASFFISCMAANGSPQLATDC